MSLWYSVSNRSTVCEGGVGNGVKAWVGVGRQQLSRVVGVGNCISRVDGDGDYWVCGC